MQILSSTALGMLVPLLMATVVIVLRMRGTKKPVSARRIILPPLFMSTGFAMFHFPETATPLIYDAIAFFVGMIFSIPLILTSRFEIVGQDVYLKRSRAFFGILVALVVIRFAMKLWVNDSLTTMQTAGLFFVLAYGMIVPWRLAMLYMYRQLVKKTVRT
ncbi:MULTISPECIES: CcdC family protein [Brevibacillus]|jgi:membrane protein CcdC involved in cytochrome C biogenesis|uniref:Cytochrome c biogenesis protein CcdC n=1 Tax=Brevibacillus thermoruber TaxID=33942 RepID=A0A9X3TNM8_9BACL|nr:MULTISPECIES: cytochrome c biogenesis protein CcdC [Brevibacillus]MDA5107695.1 cytochrome c biogenesis protein CcdC [Brevibacillus thermoruber]TRY25605.1 cytochrome c biogenesis protein CcdC [Brevibacillus sp. LEMMJ03]UYZ14988.1 cytochrome c biogenesis protein CcdC [Brevibacillus sp. WF146]